ncbi:MATE family efflux transporter [Eubacteriales bacterium OttesenSCG-928-A19]|nr:MATE family efflux transporter [Eubacteriales bacterium OttesenSCG-928-A19]
MKDSVNDSMKQNAITQGVIWKQLLLFFFPILFGSLFQQLYSMVDAVVVGQFAGKEALAAIDSTWSLGRLFVNLFVGMSTGATILISQHYGAGRHAEVSSTVHTAVAFSFVGGAVLTAMGVGLSPAGVAVMRVPADLAPAATAYLRVYCAGMIPSMVYNMGAGILRAVGDSRRPLVFLIVSSIVNIALDLLFVAVFRWGAVGAGVATVIAQAVSMALVLASLVRARDVSYGLRPREVRMDRAVLKGILQKGLPIGLQSAMYPISNSIIHARINAFGTDTIAAWAICGKLDFPIWVILDALGIAASTFAAQNYGAMLYDRVKQSVRVCIRLALCVIVPLSAALYLWGEPLSWIFVRDARVVALSGELIRFYAPFFFAYIWGEVLGGAIRGTGETFRPMMITMGFTCAFRIIWILWMMPADATVRMIIAAYPVTWIATSLAFILYYARYSRRLNGGQAVPMAETARG